MFYYKCLIDTAITFALIGLSLGLTLSKKDNYFRGNINFKHKYAIISIILIILVTLVPVGIIFSINILPSGNLVYVKYIYLGISLGLTSFYISFVNPLIL